MNSLSAALSFSLALAASACGTVLNLPSDRRDASSAATDDAAAAARQDAGPSDDGGVTPAAPGSVLADSIASFSATQGQGGWFYGYAVPAAGAEFALFTQFSAGRWSLGSGWLELTAEGGSPDTGSGDHWPVRRWISTAAGPVTASLRFFKTETACGNGATALVAVAGVTRWTKWIGFADALGVSEDVTLDVRAGEAVDFSIDPTQGNIACDHVHFSAVIRQP